MPAKAKEVALLQRQMTRLLDQRLATELRYKISAAKDESRRQRITERTQDRLYQRAAAQAGIDLAMINRLHDRDNKAARAQQARVTQEIAAAAPKQLEAYRRRVRRIRALRGRVEWEKGNPRLLVCQNIAAGVTVQAVTSAGANLSDSRVNYGAAQNVNTARFRARADAEGGVSICAVDVRHDFVWASDRA